MGNGWTSPSPPGTAPPPCPGRLTSWWAWPPPPGPRQARRCCRRSPPPWPWRHPAAGGAAARPRQPLRLRPGKRLLGRPWPRRRRAAGCRRLAGRAGRRALERRRNPRTLRRPWPALLLAARRDTQPQPAAAEAAKPLAFRLFADAATAPLAAALADALKAAGHTTWQANLSEATAQPPRALSGARLVVLAAPDATALPATLAQVTTLAEAARGSATGFTLVAPGGETAPEAAAILGLGRVLANEMPELKPCRIGLAPSVEAARLLPELLNSAPEPEPELHLTPPPGWCRAW
ncbi:hypothetical protein ACFQU7_20600 [Pseudoroseomonas wenyumeiae]